MNWLLNVLFGSFWSRTRDPMLGEVRRYKRGMVIFAGVAFVLLVLSLFLQPDSDPATGLAAITAQVHTYSYLALIIAVVICTLASLYFGIRYILFVRKHGVDG